MKKIKLFALLFAFMFLTQIPLVQAQIDDDEFLDEPEDVQCIPENLTTPYDSLYNAETPRNDIKKWYSFGSEYYKNKNYTSALPYLWKVFINDTGKYAKLSIRKIAYSYFNLQIVDSTLIACYKGLARYPDHGNLHYYAGYLQDNLGKFRCAIPHYEKLVEEKPDEKSYLEKLAFLYYKDENEKAVEVQKKLVDLDPQNDEYQETYILYIQNLIGDPLDAMRQAYKDDPENTDMALSYGKTAYNQGEYRESIDPLSAVLAKDPKHVEALRFRAMSLEGLEQYNASIADYKTILESEPQNAEIMCAIATDYKEMNQFSSAMYWTGKALGAKSGYGLAYMVRAEIYEAAVAYCQDKEKRGRKYDDGLVYQKAYNSYAKAANDPAYKSDAKKRMNGLKGVLPTQEEKFMNQNRKTLNMDCYTSWIK
jgi:tetratricopeptide (TPR) repeat protein